MTIGLDKHNNRINISQYIHLFLYAKFLIKSARVI